MQRLRVLLVAVGMLCALPALPPSLASEPAPQIVRLTPEDDVQRSLNAGVEGTIFRFAPGLYRYQGTWSKGKWYGLTVTKNNTVLEAEQRRTAIFSGAVTLNQTRQLVQASSEEPRGTWAANISGFMDNTTWPKVDTGYGVCAHGYEACQHRQDLFIDNVVVRRVPTRGNLTSGPAAAERCWFLDYEASEAVLSFDPAPGVLELSYQDTWLSGHAANITVRGLILEKIANHAQTNTCEGATTVDDCEVRLAHGGGVDGRYVTNNWIHNIGQLGGGATTLFENNTVEECNYANYSYSWEAGGVKVFANKEYHDEYGSLVIRGNTVRNNFGPGLWSDGGGWNITYVDNHVYDNALAGIMHEISFHALVTSNNLSGNCWHYAQWHAGGVCPWCGYCGEIILSTSMGVNITNNALHVDTPAAGNYGGVLMYQDPRGIDRCTNITHKLRNNRVFGNSITYVSKGERHIRSGIAGYDNHSEWATAGITFDNNHYTVDAADADSPAFWWCDGLSAAGRAPCHGANFTAFQRNDGQEQTGSWSVL